MEDKLLQIINHYGINHQQRKLEEEVFEFQEAITKFEMVKDDVSYAGELIHLRDNIIEGLADVHLLMNEIQEYYKIQDEEVMGVYVGKLERTLVRMKDESK